MLRVTRRSAVKACTQAMNQLRVLLLTGPAELRQAAAGPDSWAADCYLRRAAYRCRSRRPCTGDQGCTAPVGARNSATLGDLHIFVDHSANSVPSDDRDIGGVGQGVLGAEQLGQRSVWSMSIEVGFVFGDDSA